MSESTTGKLSGIVNTAPSLGTTYVKFYAIIAADTISKVMPHVTILFSHTIIKRNAHVAGSAKVRLSRVRLYISDVGKYTQKEKPSSG